MRLCADCRAREPYFEQGMSLWVHKKPVSDAIYRLKYKNKRMYGKVFAREMAEKFAGQIRRWGIEEIVPVPLHRSRQKKRGYNQSAVIARELGRILCIPVEEKAVGRVRNTKPQKDLGKEERVKNLKGAFSASESWHPKGNILIIDDIYTTGSTISGVAGALRSAGAQKVYFLTVSIGQGI